jgi:hypothetical protein
MGSVNSNRKKEVLRLVKGIIQLVLPDKSPKLFIFGSQVGLDEWKNADIDLGLDAGEPIEWEKISTIKSLIEGIPTLYKFDVVDFARVSDRFRSVALKNIEPV